MKTGNKSFHVTETLREDLSEKDFSVSLFLCFSALPLSDEEARDVAAAFQNTSHARPWARALFRLARVLHGLPAVTIGQAPPEVFRELVALWHEASGLARPAKPETPAVSFEEVYGEWLVCWDKVKFPAARPLAKLVPREAECPPEAAGYPPNVRRLATICRELQRHAGAGPFFLGSRTAAGELGLGDHLTAWRLLNFMAAERLIVKVEAGTKARATRWRWLGRL